MVGYIYKHTSPSGKSYIGQTHQKLTRRWKSGCGYKRNCPLFNKAIKKYGWRNFIHEILWEGEFKEIGELNQLEENFILKFNTLSPNGYNLITGGNNHFISEESLKKRALSMIGKNKGKVLSEEHKKKLSESHKGLQNHRGYHHSEESKLKMSKSHKGIPSKKVCLGMKWFNNGFITKMAFECPEGFTPGRIKLKKENI